MALASRTASAILAALLRDMEPGQRLFALVDTAHSATLFNRISGGNTQCACLFDDDEAAHVGEAAPYLMELDARSELANLLGEGHGRAWCSFLCSALDLDRLLDHLRQFVKCRAPLEEGGSADAYFAFWDPRVAELWLPDLDEVQAARFFAEVDRFYGESSESSGELLRYVRVADGVGVDRIPLNLEGRA